MEFRGISSKSLELFAFEVLNKITSSLLLLGKYNLAFSAVYGL